MQTKNVGHMSAWSLARSRGYTGTREEFAQLMADYATVAERAAQSAQDAENAKEYVDEQTQIALQAARDAAASAQSASGAHEDAASARTSAQNAQQSETDALNYKNLAQRQAENSEAWAVGTRDGVDVGTQDETYHNNAKYYAGQLDTAVETATTAAANASQSATAAATSASAAAESARTLTIDNTLSKEGQAAGAKAVGDEINKFSDIKKVYTFSKSSAGSRLLQLHVTPGDVFAVSNNTTGTVGIRFMDTESGEKKEAFAVTSGEISYITVSVSAEWIQVYFNAAGTVTIESGRVSALESRLDAVKEIAQNVDRKLDGIFTENVISSTVSGSKIFTQTVTVGDVFKVTNDGASGILVRFKDSETGENKQVEGVEANSVTYITATVNASWIQIYFNAAGTVTIESGRLADIEKVTSIKENIFNSIIFEQGSINTSGEFKNNTTRLRSVSKITESFSVTCPDGFVVYYAFIFGSVGYFESYRLINKQSATIEVPSGKYCRIVIARSNPEEDLTVSDIKKAHPLEDMTESIAKIRSIPFVQFDNKLEMYASAKTIAEENEYTTSPQNLTKIYNLFDGLVDDSFVTRVDLGEEFNIAYPRYASGVASGDSEYLETPAYKTYMYKFAFRTSAVADSAQPKKKMIILGGVHGDEQAAPFNLYIFANRLVNDRVSNSDIFKLITAFDIYIVPCVNGYGMFHQWRLNGNGVNINRNFPIVKWSKYGEKGQDNYTGETAGSEFETQLIMALINQEKPDLFIDHHNFTYNMRTQFYTSVFDRSLLPLVHQSLVDLSYVCKNNYPAHFGTNFGYVKDNGGSPWATGDTVGVTSRWVYEQDISFSATIEISDCINYTNGQYSPQRHDYYSGDSFVVSEFSLRNQILRYAQYVLDN